MLFEDIQSLGYELNIESSVVELFNENNESKVIEVKHYLPIEEKGKLVSYVINSSIDLATGCFSPLRLNTYFAIGVMKFYCGMEFDEEKIPMAYDILENSGIINRVLHEIPQEERDFIQELVDETAKDIARYNNSFAGIMASMNTDASNLGNSIQDIMEKIKNKEGLEVLSEIKNVVGTD